MTADDLVQRLEKELKPTLGLTPAADEKDWLNLKNDRSYLRVKTPVRMAHHFDLQPAFLIRDSSLGTLGIVETVLQGTGPIAAQVRRHADRATYARHLLLRDYARGVKTPLTVELVLLAANDVVAEIGVALRELQRTTDSLYHLGIGLLVVQDDAEAFRVSLRRAFPWLLNATTRWLNSANSKPPSPAADAAAQPRLERIRLDHYRLGGVRTVELAPSPTRVHLVHGPNGSGKSSLVEALEIITNGKVQRIERAHESEAEDYQRVITFNSGASSTTATTASVEVSWNSGPPAMRSVMKTGVENPLAPGLAASSFRLDQPLMERLATRSAHERAQHFLEAFFPEAMVDLTKYKTATDARDAAIQALRPYLEDFREAKRILGEIQTWRATAATTTTDEFPDVLNRWLERHALADLAERAYQVHGTLESARLSRWTMPEPQTGLLSPMTVNTAEIKSQAARWINEAGQLEQQVKSFLTSSAVEAAAEGSSQKLTTQNCEVLNRVTKWLFEGEAASQRFGDKLARVMAGADMPTFASISIGSDAWASPLLADLTKIIAACEQLETEKAAAPWPGKSTFGEYSTAVSQQAAVLQAGAALNASFFARLAPDPGATPPFDGSLIAAVNELMALFTPARWAYQDVVLPSNLRRGALGMGLEVGTGQDAMRAELRFNTAELNMFTVALFLLCAGRVPKPLGLLIFDDPLQNMDELTSTALARGLAKLVRLWTKVDRRDEILLLFHGQDDLERFQGEVSAATYRLPWLAPTGQAPNVTVEAEQLNRVNLALQTLENVFVGNG